MFVESAIAASAFIKIQNDNSESVTACDPPKNRITLAAPLRLAVGTEPVELELLVTSDASTVPLAALLEPFL